MSIYNHHDTFLPCKYRRWYYCIVERAISQARNKSADCYFEAHHILPKSLFPDYKKERWNIVLLTAREHFICHWLLIKMTFGISRHKMYKALHRISQSKDGKKIFTSMEYEIVRKYNRAFMIENNPVNNLETKEKRKQTNIEKYGGAAPASSFTVRNKMKETKLDLYGDPCYNNREKTKTTNLMNYGVECSFQRPETIKLIKDIHNEKYGCHYTQTEEYRQKRKTTAKQKQDRQVVLDIKQYCKMNKITLTKGWWQKNDKDLVELYESLERD